MKKTGEHNANCGMVSMCVCMCYMVLYMFTWGFKIVVNEHKVYACQKHHSLQNSLEGWNSEAKLFGGMRGHFRLF